jgi:hypothetical protein
MRHFWIVIIVLLSFTSCDKEEALPFQLTAEGIVGKWELYQYQGNTGANDYRTEYGPTGKTITFLPDGRFTSIEFFNCNDGEFEVEDQTLTIMVDCEERVPLLTYFMKIENKDLVLSPLAPYMCIEGCSYILKKIS